MLELPPHCVHWFYMRAYSALFVVSLLAGQGDKPLPKPVETGPAQKLKLRATPLSPQAMLRAMLVQERANRNQAGATVEVIGYEDEAVLKLLAIHVAEHTRLNFHTMDKQSQRELYAFMHQDPSRPAPVLFVPKVAGGPSAKTNSEWLK
jgi:hypothetical protein